MNVSERTLELEFADVAIRREAREILAGLNGAQKTVSPKYFYDDRGSQLFERICALPEYYLTRTEIKIMRQYANEMAAGIGEAASVIEFGIGSGTKTKLLLRSLQDPVAFIPVDISARHLARTSRELGDEFPSIEMLPVAADFTRPISLPEPARPSSRNLVYFPGSTIGNFKIEAAAQLLGVMRAMAGDNGALLIGIDLKKDPAVLHRAYNDREGVTAEFNRNLLTRLNRDFGADFDTRRFEHQAVYDEAAGRIEMRLVSSERQKVTIAGHTIEFQKGEYLLTEYSHKYGLAEFIEVAQAAGFEFRRSWQDSKEWFGILLFDSRR